MKNKNIIRTLILLMLILTISSCNKNENIDKKSNLTTQKLYINGKEEEIKVLDNVKKINIEYRDKLYILDKEQFEKLKNKDNNMFFTYDNKIIDDFNKEDIEAYKKFNDFYQVLLENGEEIKLFDKPDISSDKEIKDIDGIDSTKIVGSYKHGDHYHVKLDDGSEYITHEDPTELKSNLDKKTEKEENTLIPVVKLDYLKNKNVSKIYIHGDHYHVELDNGEKYLTYENPSKMFKDIEIKEYEGKH